MTPSGLCIIGSGYSAAALLLHLEARGAPMNGVTVIGPQALGTGQAFGCVNDDFRLNVRAELMQVWPDDPGHFANWAATNIAGDWMTAEQPTHQESFSPPAIRLPNGHFASRSLIHHLSSGCHGAATGPKISTATPASW